MNILLILLACSEKSTDTATASLLENDSELSEEEETCSAEVQVNEEVGETTEETTEDTTEETTEETTDTSPNLETSNQLLGNLIVYHEDTIIEFCSHYTIIHGDLTIRGSNITSLSELSCLTKIYGNLTILDTNIGTLDGLQNLTYIGESLEIGEWRKVNSYLTDISALQNLTYLGFRYTIQADEGTQVICTTGIGELVDYWSQYFTPHPNSYCTYEEEG